MALTRLDRLLTASGRFSRSEAKALIRAGRVTVDGKVAGRGEEKYDESAALVQVDGHAVSCLRYRTFVLHKPAGVVSATEDRRERTVLDLLPPELQALGLFPVGRLDKDTTGLLLLTNDGALAHGLTAPGRHVDKVYRVETAAALDGEDRAAFAEGLTLGDGTVCRPALLDFDPNAPRIGWVTLREGKYHQVKRMFAARGKPVVGLHRVKLGGLSLDPGLAPGAYRELEPGELALL